MLHSPSKAGNCNIKWYLKALNNSVEYGIKKTQGTNEYLVEKNSLSGIMAVINLTEAFRVFETYKKISVVKHPRTLILSAWRDKLGPPTPFSSILFVRINGNKNNNSTSISLLQFLRYLVSERHNSRSFNEHWRPLRLGS